MVRLAIVGVIVAVAFILYALVDAAMSDPARSRGVSKPVWVVIIVVLPVIGAVLWFTIGKGRGPIEVPAKAPDDDPNFMGTRMTDVEVDEHLRELEKRLQELDDEVYPQVEVDQRDAEPKKTSNPGAGSGIGSDAGAVEEASDTERDANIAAHADEDRADGAHPDTSAKPEGDSADEQR